MFNKAVLYATIASLFVASTSAICPGFNYGITQTGSNTNPDYGVWEVYDDSCNPVWQVLTNNPCTAGTFDCSPAPITFTGLHLNGLNYACRGDPNAGSCNGIGIQVCCRNDGN